MKIAFESELMENQKHAVVMAPDLAFEVLQSQEGDALFFSIGTDHIFYLTRELKQTSTGWNKVDLSSALASRHGGRALAAKAFSVAQDPQTLDIDLALVVTVGGADFLYLSLGNTNSDATWANGVTWSAIPFDAATASNPEPKPLTIAEVLMMNIPGSGDSSGPQNIFVDILRTPGDSLHLVDRYYIAPGKSPEWNLHELPADVSAGSISSCLGNRSSKYGDLVPGIYTFGTIGTEQQLIYVPKYNAWSETNPPAPPDVARLTVPQGASAIASALNASGVTNLFVAGTEGLFLFTPDNQATGTEPVQIVSNNLLAGATALAAATDANRTAVWGVGAQRDLFYVACPVGSEADPGAWSNPVPLLPSVEGFAFYLNLNAGNNVLFAHVAGQSLVQLTQDPVTTAWHQRSLLLPSTSVDDMSVYKSFTTHIQVTDDYGVGAPNAAVAITASSPVSVYLNDVYHVLSPSVALNTTADAAGVLTVVQETHGLSAVCLHVVLTDTPNVAVDINPMSKAQGILASIKTGDDLGRVQVKNADGTTKQLVPSDVSPNDKQAAAQALVQLSSTASGLHQDGSRQPGGGGAPGGSSRLAAALAAPASWGMSFANGSVRYFEGEEARLALAECSNGPSSASSVASGDLFAWLKQAFEDVVCFTIKVVEGITHFIIKIGDDLYHAVLDSLAAIGHAFEFILNKIEVFFEDLIKWLGFLFSWHDFVNTHKVLKNVLKQYVKWAIDQISTAEDQVKSAFDGIEQRIDSWAGIPTATNTIGSYQSTASSTPGYGSPQLSWALHHTKSNVLAANPDYSQGSVDTSSFEKIISDLQGMIDSEIDDLITAVTRIKTDVADQIATLTAVEVVKRIGAIITDAILTTAENVIVTLLDVIKVAVQGIVDLLDASINIPVLSPLYKQWVGDDLSILDLACLVAAIPATIIYKATTNSDAPPFSDSDTDELSGADSFASLQAILTGSRARAASPRSALTSEANARNNASLLETLTIVAQVSALLGSLVVAVFAALKRPSKEIPEPPPQPTTLRYVTDAFYILYVSPNIVQAFGSTSMGWYTKVNDAWTIMAIIKTFADNSDTLSGASKTLPQTYVDNWSRYISPVAESLINLTWLVPAVGALEAVKSPKPSDALSYSANVLFDAGGILTFLSEDKISKDPKLSAAVFILMEVLTVGYGVVSLGTGAALAMGD